ncbi:sporulation protein [Bacillus sp. TL12]|uniref:sporulation protein n=1 Tax=Bacillus sp. TL12 TaxID=2894756 RepID=UPI001F522D02|nr:sporulation protein [Bacillus sp. TL12]MCI0768207.1 sporulation protein [Bacillus sp. TL12]
MFKKILAKFGKGAATVDLRFENRSYSAGETLHGEVLIQGGEVEQKMNSLAARFMMSVVTKQGSVTREVATIPLDGAYTILPKEQKVIPFSYDIPRNLPVSRGGISYYFDTHLDIEGGVDRTDFDRLVVEAPKEVQNIFYAFNRLGFQEKSTSGKLDTYGQEFAFFPREEFVNDVDEVEIRFAYEDSGIHIWMEVDCRTRHGEMEAKREFFIEKNVLQEIREIANILKEYITEMVNNPYAYTQPFSYQTQQQYGLSQHSGSGRSPIAGMVGGLAVGILGGMLLNELMDELGVDEMVEEATEEIGINEEESFLGDFFGDSDDE